MWWKSKSQGSAQGLDAIPSEPVRRDLWQLAKALHYGAKTIRAEADKQGMSVTVVTLALWKLSDELSIVAKDIIRVIDPRSELSSRKVATEVRRIRRISSKLAEVYKSDTKMARMPQSIKDIYWEIREASDLVFETLELGR